MSALIGVEQTQIGELLPHITGHFVQKGVFPVDNFVVGEGKEEVLGEGVEQGKSELVVLIFAMNGSVGKGFERVVRPAHVPFEAETKTTAIGGTGDGGPGGGPSS